MAERLEAERILLRKLGERIEARRKELGLTQEDLAQRSDLDRAYVGEVERGAYSVGFINLASLAHGLALDVGDLTAGLTHDPFQDG